MSYSIIKNQEKVAEAMKLARGCYQRALINGSESLSGATLRGKAKNYIGRYRQSGQNLLARLENAGLAQEKIGAHNKRLLVIG